MEIHTLTSTLRLNLIYLSEDSFYSLFILIWLFKQTDIVFV